MERRAVDAFWVLHDPLLITVDKHVLEPAENLKGFLAALNQ